MEQALVKFGMNKDDEAIKLLAPILVDADQLRERYIYLSFSLLEMQKFETSDAYFEKAMMIHASSFPYYRRGRAYAKIDQKDRAFTALNKAVDLGNNARREYENNPDLTGLKNDSRWQTLMEKMRQ
jgi:tetratricopeptide (TPR) repeat protein